MQIIGREIIDAAIEAHSEWKASLEKWKRIVGEAQWKNPVEVRQTFKDADPVKKVVVFDIAHNKARLIAVINYEAQRVIVSEILTHAEYNREDFTK